MLTLLFLDVQVEVLLLQLLVILIDEVVDVGLHGDQLWMFDELQ